MKPSFIVWLTYYPFYIAPACALLAGAVTWVLHRGRQPADAPLLSHFTGVMGLLLIGSYAVTSSAAMMERLDPSIKVRRELEAAPIHAALRTHMPDAWKPLNAAITKALAAQATAPQVLEKLRPAYVNWARAMLPTASDTAARGYVTALLPALKTLQVNDPRLCVQLAWPGTKDLPFVLNDKVSADAAQAWEAAVADLIVHNSQAVTYDPKDEIPNYRLTREGLAQAYLALRDGMEPRYGDVLPQLHTDAVHRLDPTLACAATINMLGSLLRQPAIAGRALTVGLFGRRAFQCGPSPPCPVYGPVFPRPTCRSVAARAGRRPPLDARAPPSTAATSPPSST